MWSKAKQAIIDSSPESSVYIGCDSRRIPNKNKALYSVVVIIHKDSSKGCNVFNHTVTLPDYGQLKPRLLTEVQLAVDTTSEFLDIIGDRHIEVHLDINPNPKHKSNVAVKDALGWVKGSLGMDAKIKPNSFAASAAADRWVNM